MIYNGLYSGLVLDNSTYFATGTIRVRVFLFYMAPRFYMDGENKKSIAIDDLSSKPSMIDDGKLTDPDTGVLLEGISHPNQDFVAWVSTPMGGGTNYGIFHLPQVNERGIVSFLDGDLRKPVWMGSYFTSLEDPNNIIEQISTPNDDVIGSKDGVGYGIASKDRPVGDPNAIIIRTKHTELIPKGSDYDAEKLNWQNQTTENLVLLGSDQIRVRHYSDFSNSKYQEILMNQSVADSSPLITTSVIDKKNSYSTIVNQSSTSFSVTITGSKGSFTWSVTGGDTGIYLKDQFGNTIFGNADGIAIQGTGDNLTRFSYLKNVIDKIAEHVHITQGPAGPTTGPVDASGAPALSQVISQDESKIQIKKIITSSS
jgi:hypothetical protein